MEKVTANLEQLLHFRNGPIWDGDLISKQARDQLDDAGLIKRAMGFQFLTAAGVTLLVRLGYLRENRPTPPSPNQAQGGGE